MKDITRFTARSAADELDYIAGSLKELSDYHFETLDVPGPIFKEMLYRHIERLYLLVENIQEATES